MVDVSGNVVKVCAGVDKACNVKAGGAYIAAPV